MPKPRYAKQPTNHGCAPTAIVNALKWAGYKASIREHYKFLEKSCRANHEDVDQRGTYGRDLSRVMTKYISPLIKVKLDAKPTMTKIQKHLKKGGAVVLMYKVPNEEFEYHVSLLIECSEDGKLLVGVNEIRNVTLAVFERERMDFFLNFSTGSAAAWLLTRYNNNGDKNGRSTVFNPKQARPARKAEHRHEHRGAAKRPTPARRNRNHRKGRGGRP